MTKEEEINLVSAAYREVEAGAMLEEDILYRLTEIESPEALKLMRDHAAALTQKLPRNFDSCSIVNARSGRCSEDCKWCAQSGHFHTGCNTYDIVDRDEALAQARHNSANGVKRFSLVASGRSVKGRALDQVCAILKEAKESTGIHTCASLGLLNKEELEKLYASGARRYHSSIIFQQTLHHPYPRRQTRYHSRRPRSGLQDMLRRHYRHGRDAPSAHGARYRAAQGSAGVDTYQYPLPHRRHST